MKKVILYIFALAFFHTACTEDPIVIIGDTTLPVLTNASAGQTVVLTADNLEANFNAFNWSEADFGFQSADPEYTLQMDLAGNNFAAPLTLISTADRSWTTLNSVINQKLFKLGATAGTSIAIEFRVIGSIHADYNAVSNAIAVSITPVEVVIEYPKLYVSGSQNAWGFDEKAVLFSVADNGVFEGYVYLANEDKWPEFKLLTETVWDNANVVIGDPDASLTSGTLQVGDWGGNNILAQATAGVFKIKADLEKLTYSVARTDWAMTGDFNGWAMASMTYNMESDTFSYTADFTVGGFKFIANEDWGMTLGDEGLDNILDPGTDGNNIQITEAGNYTVTLDLSGAIYKYTLTKN